MAFIVMDTGAGEMQQQQAGCVRIVLMANDVRY